VFTIRHCFSWTGAFWYLQCTHEDLALLSIESSSCQFTILYMVSSLLTITLLQICLCLLECFLYCLSSVELVMNQIWLIFFCIVTNNCWVNTQMYCMFSLLYALAHCPYYLLQKSIQKEFKGIMKQEKLPMHCRSTSKQIQS